MHKLITLIAQANFFDLSSGCRSCNCNMVGSESSECDQNSPVAQCPCRPKVDSIRCNTPIPGYYFKPLDSILFEAEEAAFSNVCSMLFCVSAMCFKLKFCYSKQLLCFLLRAPLIFSLEEDLFNPQHLVVFTFVCQHQTKLNTRSLLDIK